jgi:hypothetical protein
LIRHSITWPRNGGNSVTKPFPCGDPNLLLHQVDARQHFGHRVFDLDAVFISMK